MLKKFFDEDPLVSAILPVYNVDEYLDKSVKSLLNQSYKNIEIIIVDDGSKDSSLRIANNLSEQYDNVNVISQSNAGAAVARNIGIKNSKGKYLYFMDPDDWMKDDYIASLVSSAENNDSQLVIGGFTNIYYIGEKVIRIPVKLGKTNYEASIDFRKDATKYLNNTTLAVPWNKLYLASYIINNELEFPNVKWDDLHFNLEVIRNIKRVSSVDSVEYQFLRNRPGSETTTVFNGKLFANRKSQFKHVLDVFQSWNLTRTMTEEVFFYFSSRVVQVVQEISSEKTISNKNKRRIVSDVLNDDMVIESFQKQGGGGILMNISIGILKTRNVSLSILIGKLISFVKKDLTKVFLAIRSSSMRI